MLKTETAPRFCGRVDRVQAWHRANVLRGIENGPAGAGENDACFMAVGLDGHHFVMMA